MKKSVLGLLLMLLVSLTARAQTTPAWATAARWNYMAGLPFGAGFGTLQLNYVGDTTISGRICQKLRRDVKYGANNPQRLQPLFTAADADRVSVYVSGQFVTLYDFSARPGDSWSTVDAVAGAVFCSTRVQVTVDSVGQQLIGGQLRRWFRAHYTPYTIPGSPVQTRSWGRVYEGIGPVNGFMTLSGANYPVCGGTDPAFVGALTCYSVNGQGVYTDSPTASCSLIITAVKVAEPEGFAVYPSISAGPLTVRLPGAYQRATAQVFDQVGRLVWQQALPGTDEAHLNLQKLPAGMYQLRVQQAGQPLLSRRIVRQ